MPLYKHQPFDQPRCRDPEHQAATSELEIVQTTILSPTSPSPFSGDLGESLQTLQIPVVNPFQAVHETSDEVRIPNKATTERWLLDDEDDDSFDEYSVTTEFTCMGPWEVNIDKIVFVADASFSLLPYSDSGV